jgi:hypothetical protein
MRRALESGATNVGGRMIAAGEGIRPGGSPSQRALGLERGTVSLLDKKRSGSTVTWVLAPRDI